MNFRSRKARRGFRAGQRQVGSGRLWALGVILFAAYMASRFGGGRQTEAATAERSPIVSETERKLDSVRATCRQFIRNRARDPDSLQFLSLMSDTAVVTVGPDEFKIVQQIRGANGYGGKSLDWYACRVRVEGANVRLLSLNTVNEPS